MTALNMIGDFYAYDLFNISCLVIDLFNSHTYIYKYIYIIHSYLFILNFLKNFRLIMRVNIA